MEATLLVTYGFIFVCAAIAAGAGAWLLTDPQLLQKRLSSTVGAVAIQTGQRESLIADRLPGAVKQIRSFVPKSPKSLNRIERRLMWAGYHGPWPATLFAIAELVIPAAVFGIIVYSFGTGTALIFALLAA